MNAKPSLHVVMHVPKTGGASLSNGLVRSLGKQRVLRADWFDQLVHHSKTKGLSRYHVVISHISGRELLYLADDFELKVSTFLRDPVSRVFSNYCFWRQFTPDIMLNTDNGKIPLIDQKLDWKEDLNRILSHSSEIWKFRELSDVATWQFATSLYERSSRDSKQALQDAKSRLNSMEFVGFQENLATDFKALVDLIDPTADPSPLGQINKTISRNSLVLDDAARDMIARFNTLDIELFEWARQQFSRD